MTQECKDEKCPGVALRIPHFENGLRVTGFNWVAENISIEDLIMVANYHKPTESDMVNHPPHYNSHPSGIECITITRHMNFNLGNAIKYIWRCDLKSENPIEDLRKSIWYLQNEIDRLEHL